MWGRWCIHHRYVLLFTVLLACFYGYGIGHIYGFMVYPDEFGYWAHAARIAGYDWSDVTSLGAYYSFGYSIILLPIFCLFKNGVIAYRAAVTLNFVLLVVDMLLLYRIAAKFLENQQGKNKESKELMIVFSAIAVFFPSNLFYAWMTMTEIPLFTVYILICFFMFEYLSHSKLSTLICLLIALLYIFFVHMRSAGVVIAGVCIILLHAMLNLKKSRQILFILFAGIVVLEVGMLIKGGLSHQMYVDADKAFTDANSLLGQLNKLRYILTLQGIIDLLISLAGKLLYLGLASYGIFYWGMYALIKYSFKGIKKAVLTKHIKTRPLFYIFIVLSVISQIMVSAIYMVKPQRLDNLTYGRYNEFILPVVLIAGLKELSKGKQKPKLIGTVIIAVLQMAATHLVINIAEEKGLISFHGYFMAGMSYLYDEVNFDVKSFFWKAYILGMIFTVLVTLIACCVKQCQSRFFIWTIVIALEIVLAIRLDVLYKNPFSKAAYRDTCMVKELEQHKKTLSFRENGQLNSRRIVYIEEEGLPFVDILQFSMREEPIIIYRVKELQNDYKLLKTDLVVLNFESPQASNMESRYRYSDKYGHFILFYN